MPSVKRIIVDADSSPVVQEIIQVAEAFNLTVLLVMDFAHYRSQTFPAFVTIQYVDTGNDSADYAIKKVATSHDLVVTGDFGLASLLLATSKVMHHNGKLYTQETIDMLLLTRYHHQLARKAKQRVKGPSKFTAQHRQFFIQSLTEYIEKNLAN